MIGAQVSPGIVLTLRHLSSQDFERLWERRNEKNRKLSSAVIARYRRDMLNGKFHLSDSMICILPDGTVLNGHHRIEAGRRLPDGVQVIQAVCENFPPQWGGTVDQGWSRQAWQSLELMGVEASQKMVAVANAVRAGIGQNVRGKLTVAELAVFFSDHKDALTIAAQAMRELGGHKGIGRAQVGAVIMRAAYHLEAQLLASFVAVLGGTPARSEEESAATALAIVLTRDSHRDADPAHFYRLTESALAAFAAKEPRRVIRPTFRELYPLPEEEG